MDPLNWLISTLRTAKDLFPIEIALTLGVVFFALSWVVRRPLVTLPTGGGRASVLTWLGIFGALAILAVATLTNWLAYRFPFETTGFDGWLRRPAPLLAASLIIGIGASVLWREPLPAPGERALAPRRKWWAFTPPLPSWITAGAAAALVATTGWHTLIGVSAPADANRFGNVPEQTDLPVYFEMLGGSGYVAGAGWPNHLATLIAVALAAVVLVLALAQDAHRPVSARITAADTRSERTATARVMVFLILGALLLTLGAVWAYVGFAGDRSVGSDFLTDSRGIDSDSTAETPVYFLGSNYQAFAGLMHKSGFVLQGIGAAILLRLATDTVRAALARTRAVKEPRASGPQSVAQRADATTELTR